MGELNVQLCPETGICSIIKDNGKKVDLMPDEVAALRAAYGAGGMKNALAEVDTSFAEGLANNELDQVAAALK